VIRNHLGFVIRPALEVGADEVISQNAFNHSRATSRNWSCPLSPGGSPARAQRNHYQSRANAFFDHQCEITCGVLQKECAAILQDFISEKMISASGGTLIS
jgi:hypothetical protein